MSQEPASVVSFDPVLSSRSLSSAYPVTAEQLVESLFDILDRFHVEGSSAQSVVVSHDGRVEAVLLPAALFDLFLQSAEDDVLSVLLSQRLSEHVSVDVDAALVSSWGLDPAKFDL